MEKNKKIKIEREGIYLDNAATTRVNDSVAEVVTEVMLENYGNASSLHTKGKKSKEKFKESKEKIANYIGCNAREIIFTSGGTESNNLAIRGLARANPKKRHIITSKIEHPCVLETCKDLERDGYNVDYLDVDSDGLVSLNDVEKRIRDDTLIVSIMHVNNEIGVIEPVEKIGLICKNRGVYFHTDNVQGFLKETLSLDYIDLMSISGHKVCAPKGIGVLYVREGVKIKSIISGGGQEGGLRSGTENVPGAAGLAQAVDIDFRINEVRISRDKIIHGLEKIKGMKINGSKDKRIYNNINVSFYGIEGESLMLMLNEAGIYVSTGSACASTKLSESYVLKAIGTDEMYIHGSLRLSLGVDIFGNEEYVIKKIHEGVEKLREISPFKFEEKKIEKEVRDGEK